MASYGSRNSGSKTKQNVKFYLKSKDPSKRDALLSGSKEEQLAVWDKKPAKLRMLMVQAAKAKAKRRK